MGHYSLEDFIIRTGERAPGQGVFELEREQLLKIYLNGVVWTRMGSMMAYKGGIRFSREDALERGPGKLVKISLAGEGFSLIKAEGRGKLYLADRGKKISVLKLESDSICVNCNDILAIEDSLNWDIRMMRKLSGVVENEIYNVKLEGTGMVAITTHHDPLTFRVTREYPVFTSPNATVAWSGNLEPEIKTDISLKTLIEKSSGESVQMVFRGEGFVVVQPCEEVYSQTQPENKISNVYIS
ncbi:AIM24 family protein [Methanosarcina sp. T3]|uniref:AIM24 family protein n=1 Tax=Methanosarcina sp. T3 TaxID=3439062 RepID=UPI003F862DBC